MFTALGAGVMSRSEEAAKLRLQARVCRDLAEAAPTEAERKYWLKRADEATEQATQLEQE
jgi:hypothetical protein